MFCQWRSEERGSGDGEEAFQSSAAVSRQETGSSQSVLSYLVTYSVISPFQVLLLCYIPFKKSYTGSIHKYQDWFQKSKFIAGTITIT